MPRPPRRLASDPSPSSAHPDRTASPGQGPTACGASRACMIGPVCMITGEGWGRRRSAPAWWAGALRSCWSVGAGRARTGADLLDVLLGLVLDVLRRAGGGLLDV